jgi:2-polyprenyl-6-methoxyphenol hydroxylase-like FAD-dependent oxidoreductase
MSDHQVIIVGAGPSGLALAIELGSRGVKCLLLEKNERVGYAPRAKTTNVRTRTHLRRWGIAGKLAAVSPLGIDYPAKVHFVTRLAGPSLAVIDDVLGFDPTPHQAWPEHGQWVPQYKLEQVLREHVEGLPSVELRFNTEFVGARQDEDGVTVELRARSGGLGHERGGYLVGADGARSQVRDLIGARMSGEYGLSRNYNIVFRAPGLARAHPHGPGVMFWQVNPDAPSLIGPMDSDDIWFFMPTKLPDGFKIGQEAAEGLIREATGIDLPIEILSSDEWVASSLIADRYRQGRIYLIGDASHLHPPFGGYGMNMGIADGVDLGWKLAATCQGWGGPNLPSTYEAERRAIHEAVIAEAAANHATGPNELWRDVLEDQSSAGENARAVAGERIRSLKAREFHTMGTVLGACYESSPIIENDGSTHPPHDSMHYEPTSRPGCLAPHFWWGDGHSLYDDFGSGFTLACRPGTAPGCIAAVIEEASIFTIPLKVVGIGDEHAAAGYPAPLTLIRPDQYVAWRGDSWRPGALRRAAGWEVASTIDAPPLVGERSAPDGTVAVPP